MTPRQEEQLHKKLGSAIRKARKELNLAQDELASESELDRAYMGRIERGETSVSMRVLGRICKALKLKPSELLAMAGL